MWVPMISLCGCVCVWQGVQMYGCVLVIYMCSFVWVLGCMCCIVCVCRCVSGCVLCGCVSGCILCGCVCDVYYVDVCLGVYCVDVPGCVLCGCRCVLCGYVDVPGCVLCA